MISAQTAMDIALAYREIETAENLLAKITDEIDRRKVPDVRDAFGRLQDGLQLGVPSGDNSQRLFNVPWSLAKPVIELHIAHKRARIATLNATAAEELAASAMGTGTAETPKVAQGEACQRDPSGDAQKNGAS